MWCPRCNCDSPHVAVLHTGIVCARCESEVLASRPESKGKSTAQKPSVPAPTPTAGSAAAISPNLTGSPVFRFDAPHPLTGGESSSGAETGKKTQPQKAPSATNGPAPELKVVKVAHAGRMKVPEPAPAAPLSQRVDGSHHAEPAAPPVYRTPGIAGPLLVFFAGQFTIAWAWYWSSFPAFSAGILVTLFGAGLMLRAMQRAVAVVERVVSGSDRTRKPLQSTGSSTRQRSGRSN